MPTELVAWCKLLYLASLLAFSLFSTRTLSQATNETSIRNERGEESWSSAGLHEAKRKKDTEYRGAPFYVPVGTYPVGQSQYRPLYESWPASREKKNNEVSNQITPQLTLIGDYGDDVRLQVSESLFSELPERF